MFRYEQKARHSRCRWRGPTALTNAIAAALAATPRARSGRFFDQLDLTLKRPGGRLWRHGRHDSIHRRSVNAESSSDDVRDGLNGGYPGSALTNVAARGIMY
jgi:hypothetical protein